MKYSDYFAAIPTLQSARLTLRAFTLADIPVYRAIMQNREVPRHMARGLQDFADDAAVDRWLHNINHRLLKSKHVFTWCIEHTADREVIGRIDLGGFVRQSMAELSYHLAPDRWGSGYATEAVAAVTSFAFEKLHLHRVQAFVLPQNPASCHVLEKTGFKEEGLLRKYDFGHEFHDCLVFAAIREENMK